MPKNTPPEPDAAAAAATLLKYEVMVPELSCGPVTAYRTAVLNLTKAEAEAINSAAPGAVEFRGI